MSFFSVSFLFYSFFSNDERSESLLGQYQRCGRPPKEAARAARLTSKLTSNDHRSTPPHRYCVDSVQEMRRRGRGGIRVGTRRTAHMCLHCRNYLLSAAKEGEQQPWSCHGAQIMVDSYLLQLKTSRSYRKQFWSFFAAFVMGGAKLTLKGSIIHYINTWPHHQRFSTPMPNLATPTLHWSAGNKLQDKFELFIFSKNGVSRMIQISTIYTPLGEKLGQKFGLI